MNRTNICKNIVQSIKDYITDQVKLEPHLFFLLPLTRLNVFLCCRIQLPQQSCFLLHKTSVEYTRLYSSIAEVLIYTVEPRISCNDVFSKCWIVEHQYGLLSRHFCTQICSEKLLDGGV